MDILLFTLFIYIKNFLLHNLATSLLVPYQLRINVLHNLSNKVYFSTNYMYVNSTLYNVQILKKNKNFYIIDINGKSENCKILKHIRH